MGPVQGMDQLRKQAGAYRDLLGFQALPQTGRQAQAAARQLGAVVLIGVTPPPLLAQLAAEELAAAAAAGRRARFVDVSTGLRLRYLEWGSSGSSDVVLLLHDLGEAADIWRHVGAKLADRGYRVLAMDLRGHGESGRSLDGRYSAEALAEDVKAFIVAKDLYVAPLAVVGCGMGAAVGLALAQASPFLVGALLAAEFTLPVAAVREASAAVSSNAAAVAVAAEAGGAALAAEPAAQPAVDHVDMAGRQAVSSAIKQAQNQLGTAAAAAAVNSKELLPWWGFRPGQASEFSCLEQCAAFLAHPLCNMAPGLLLPLELAASRAACPSAAASSTTSKDASSANSGSSGSSGSSEQAQAELRQLFAQLQRPLRGAVASAVSLLRLPAGLAGAGGSSAYYWEDDEDEFGGAGGRLQPRMDPTFLFGFDAAALLGGMANLRCHLLLVQASRASWADPADASAMAAAAAAGGAASAAVGEQLPGTGHWLAADHPDQLLTAIVALLEGPAIRCFDRAVLPSSKSSASGSAGSSGASSHGSAAAAAAAAQAALGCRRPELLDLKPLPQYASLEEAQKALGPRAIPTAAAVEAELRRLRVEEGRDASDASSDEEGEEGEVSSRQRTGLAKDPPTYFGFVG